MQNSMKNLALATLILATACSDRDDDDMQATGDASANDDASGDASDHTPTGCTCVALGADYQQPVGVLSTVELPAMTVAQDRVPLAISNDPVVHVHGGRVYVVNRFGADNITIIDPSTWTVVDQFSTGGGSNPQDLVIVGQRAFVAAYDLPAVQVWDLTDTEEEPALIDLSSYLADAPDGTSPEPTSIHRIGDRVYVVLEHMDRTGMLWTALRNSRVVVIDPQTATVESTFDLAHENAGGLGSLGEDLAATSVTYDELYVPVESCLERVTLSPAPTSAGCLTDLSVMGGGIGKYMLLGEELFLHVSKVDYSTEIARILPEGSGAPSTVVGPAYNPGDYAYCATTHQLLFVDRTVGALRVYDLDDGQVVSPEAGLDIGLPPVFGGGLSCWDR